MGMHMMLGSTFPSSGGRYPSTYAHPSCKEDGILFVEQAKKELGSVVSVSPNIQVAPNLTGILVALCLHGACGGLQFTSKNKPTSGVTRE